MQFQISNLGDRPYRPVAIKLGQDSRRPANSSLFFQSLFGTELFTSDLPVPFIPSWPDAHDANKFIDACNRFGHLLEKSTLHLGSYGRIGNDQPIDQIQPHPINDVLRKAKQTIDAGQDSDRAEHEKLKSIARFFGHVAAREVNADPESPFGWSLPTGFDKDPKAYAEKFPSLVFFGWHPDYREAFRLGFRELCTLPYYKDFHVASDPAESMFVTPCAGNVIDEIQVALKLRPEHTIRPEDTALRHRLIAASQQLVTASQRPITKPYPNRHPALVELYAQDTRNIPLEARVVTEFVKYQIQVLRRKMPPADAESFAAKEVIPQYHAYRKAAGLTPQA